jgi:hypothetical protein
MLAIRSPVRSKFIAESDKCQEITGLMQLNFFRLLLMWDNAKDLVFKLTSLTTSNVAWVFQTSMKSHSVMDYAFTLQMLLDPWSNLVDRMEQILNKSEIRTPQLMSIFTFCFARDVVSLL